jgi:long-chain acyl-CoA synthetase
MPNETWPSLPALFFARAAAEGDAPFLWGRRDGEFRATSWRDAAAQAAALATALRALGVTPGDRVALVSENRPEWPIADLAIMTAGAITVPAYTTNGPDDHRHLLGHSGAKGAIVSNAALASRLAPALADATEMGFAILIDDDAPALPQHVAVHRWEAMLAAQAATAEDGAAMAAALTRADTACLIYTSGTGGRPKGVMLSHGAVLANCDGARAALRSILAGRERFLCFLPLSHSYEHTAGLYFPILIGAEIFYTDAEQLSADLVRVRPTIMTAVPRLYEVMHDRIRRGVARQGGVGARLFEIALALGRARYEGRRLGAGARMLDVASEALVRRKVRAGFGGRLKALVSGGAPLNPEIGVFFTALGMRILQGYGQTESAPVISVNRPGSNRMDTVGAPLDGVEVRIAPDGEILVRGEMVMQGYWNDAAATASAIVDGWLHTGDVGVIEPDGQLRITDRKKDIIVLSGGDNVAPQRVEGLLTLEPEIAQAVVYGDKRPHLVALIAPDPAFAAEWAQRTGVPPERAALIDAPAFRDAIAAAVERVNRVLSPIERVRRFALTGEGFTIDNGMMTPTLKPRRAAIVARYGTVFEGLYGG